MQKLSITGYGDDLTVNDIRIGDLSPTEHEDIEKNNMTFLEVLFGCLNIFLLLGLVCTIIRIYQNKVIREQNTRNSIP